MNVTEFFLQQENWSFSTAITLLLFYGGYFLLLKPKIEKAINMAVSVALIYLVLGSPLYQLLQYGLHSVFMIMQIIIFMIVPVFLWKALPEKINFSGIKNKKTHYVLFWLIGAMAMWGGHFMSAYKLASETGIPVCGITAAPHSWTSFLPIPVLLLVLLLAGMVFSQPVFHPEEKNRISNPLNRIAYLFTSCVSCSVLGLWVVFTASFVPETTVFTEFVRMGNPWTMSLKTDQEMAGMIMWVPGCVLYVSASVSILFNWMERKEPSVVA